MRTTETKSTTTKKPALIAYQVRNKGEEGFWTKVGVAFQNADGKGYSLLLDAVPLDGRIILRTPTEKAE